MSYFDAVILSVVEGLTEFLPVSSTGHMILVSNILGIASDPFTKVFEVVIQFAAICAVIFIYWKTIVSSKSLVLKVASAFIPTAVLGLLLHSFIKAYLFESVLTVVIALFIGGIAIIFFEKWAEKKRAASGTSEIEQSPSVPLADITYKKAFFVGLWQSLAMIPGVSRSAATIIGGEAMGITRKSIVEFSFLLAIPTMLAATVLDLHSSSLAFTEGEWKLLAVGCIVSFAVAFLAVKSFLKYIQSHSFAVFGYYRIVLAIVYAIFFLGIW